MVKYKLNKDELHNYYYNNNLSIHDISNIYKCSSKTVLKWMKFYNIPRRSVQEACSGDFNKHIGNKFGKKYTLNESFFNEWSPDMAWVLGFIYADGCLHGDGLVSISQKEKQPLEEILKLLNANSPIEQYKRTGVFYIRIYSINLIKTLRLIGLKERKSLDIEFPEIPDEYFWDFVRGYFDGDGSFYYRKNKYLYLSFAGCNKFITQLNNLISIHLNIPVRNIDHHKPLTAQLQYFPQDIVLSIGNHLYKNSHAPKLNRKFDKFIQWKNNYFKI